jgi:Pvc16 N-terminal domain
VSNALAIATVTQTLRNILHDAIGISNVAGAQVKFVRPDDAANLPATGVNVFLYQVAPNTALRNADLPTRMADGTLLQRPQAALDLFYLITFYGDDAQLEQQRMLGAVTLTLHAQPWLPQADIVAAQGAAYLAGADLSAQSEKVRFRPVSFSLEELSKLWSFLLKTDYVLSAAYVASVVLIDTSEAVPGPALPVLQPQLLTLPIALPVITQIQPAAGPGPILPGSAITLSGSNLLGPVGTSPIVLVGTTTTLIPSTASATALTVTLPAGLPAGLTAASVVQQPLLGIPPVAHAGGITSTPALFTLCPQIRRTGSPAIYQIAVATGVGAPPSDQVTVTLDPAIQPGQRAVLALRPAATQEGALPLLFDGGVATVATNTAVFLIGIPPSGGYFVQVIVDNAESVLDLGPGGTPTGPEITL